jgi:cytochrome c-type biogenesis protein CcmH/NrfG
MEIKLIDRRVILLIFCFCSFNVQAQKQQTAEDLVNHFSATIDSITKESNHKAKLTGQEKESIITTGNSSYDSIEFDRKLKQYDFAAMHQQRCFAWQYYSSILIFIMVILIVGMGLVLSYKQFQLSEVQVKANIVKPKSEVTEVTVENTNIEISQTGLKINTGVIGLAILFLSLAFFFLYLKYVYQIDIIETSK